MFWAQNIDCGYALEPPRRGGSNEYPQSMFWAEIWKLPEFFIWKFSFLVVKFSIYLDRHVFVMVTFCFVYIWPAFQRALDVKESKYEVFLKMTEIYQMHPVPLSCPLILLRQRGSSENLHIQSNFTGLTIFWTITKARLFKYTENFTNKKC